MRQGLAAGLAAVLATAGMASSAVAAPGDESEASAQLIDGDLLGLDLAGLIRAESGTPSNPTVDTANIDAAVLEDLIGLEVGSLDVPLISDGTNGGLLDLGDAAAAGVLNGYAYAPDGYSASAASGAVSDDGAINLDAVSEHDGTDLARLDATALLDDLGLAPVTDAVVDEVSLGLGALASSADASTGTAVESDYVVAGAELTISSPAVAGLVGAVDTAVDDVDTTVNGLLGPEGVVQGSLDTLSFDPVDVLGLVTLDLGSPQLNATVNLDQVTAGLLEDPLVSENGLVAIDVASGDTAVDLEMLHGGNLNDLDPNTQLLTAEEITQITDTVANLLGQVTGLVTDAVNEALLTTDVMITLNPTVSAVGGLVSGDPSITIAGTLGQFTGATDADPEVDVSGGLTVDLPVVPDVEIPVGDLLGAVLEPVLTSVVPAVGSVLQPVLDDGGAVVEDVLGTVVNSAVNSLDPVLDQILAELLTVTINEQTTAEDGTFTVSALSVDLLPALSAVELPLATSSVRVLALDPAVDAAPAEIAAGETLTSDITGFVPDSDVTVTYTDADGTVLAEQPVTLDDTGSGVDEFAVPDGTVLGDLSVTVSDPDGNSATDTVSVVAAAPANTDPILSGVDDTSIVQGSSFDPLEGVSASDAEDGDLTGAIEVTGAVDTQVPGTYGLTYTVTDSQGASATDTRTVTVTAYEASPLVVATPAELETGETVSADIAGFVPNSDVTVTYTDSAGTVLAEQPVALDDSGAGVDSLLLPGETAVGDLTITVADATGNTATDTVSVLEPGPGEPANFDPTISGVADSSIEEGAAFDPLAGVTAADEEDGDLTAAIEVDGTVDTTMPGSYELTYSVTDSQGASASATRTVTVTEAEAPVLDPSVVASPDEVAPGEPVTVEFEGFEPGDTVVVEYADADGDVIETAEVVVDDNGNGSDELVVLEGNVPGDLTVVVSDPDGNSATDTVTVLDVVDPAPINVAPVITGADSVSVEQGTAFDPLAGVTAADEEDGDLTDAIEVDGTVDTTTPGSYELTYSVTDSQGAAVSVTRSVTVTEATPEVPANTAPVISGADGTSVEQGTSFDPLAGVTASDEEDGDLTEAIEVEGDVDTSTPGTYELTYSVTDSGGAKVTVARSVTVTEAVDPAPTNTAPVIAGADGTSVEQGTDFDPLAGVSASDEEDGDLTDAIAVDGTVDTATPGTYELTYSVTDSGGAKVTVARSVTVTEAGTDPAPINTAPVISGADGTSVEQGTSFEPLAGVSATDEEDGDLRVCDEIA